MAAPGGTELSKLIGSMSPELASDTYVWATMPDLDLSNQAVAELLSIADMFFREKEGWTIILPRAEADKRQLEHVFPSKKITLNVHSSLEAVGFIAAISARLTSAQVGVNPVSGYFHDHLFIPEGKEDLVMEQLREMVAAESAGA